MSREARLQGGLAIRKVTNGVQVMDHRPAYNGFVADVAGTKGPTPGDVTIGPNGTNIDLSQLTEPGWCELFNRSDTQTIQYGIWDTDSTTFYPIGELEPGHGHTIKFSRNFGERHDEGVGTGTTGSGICKLRIYSGGASNAVVYVGAFER